MTPPSRAHLCLAIALMAGSCLADFDRHRVSFTEGPLVFRFDRDVMDLPPELLSASTVGCEVAEVGCLDEACTGGGTCGEDGTCIYRTTTLLSTAVVVDDAFADELLRVDSVAVRNVTATLTGSSFTQGVDEVRILWAPFTAGAADALEIARIGPLPPGGQEGPLELVESAQGLGDLETYLLDYPSFQLFLEFTTTLEPGEPCPEGQLELEISLRFLITGEPVI